MTTWKITMKKIERESPQSMELLKLLSFLSAEEIPEHLVKEVCVPTENSLQFIEARTPLLQFALLQRIKSRNYRIHRLVGFWVRMGLGQEERAKRVEVIIELLQRKLPRELVDDLPSCTQLLPHITTVLGHAERSHNSQHLALLGCVGAIYLEKGEYKDAENWYQQALGGKDKPLGRGHPFTLSAVGSVAVVLGSQGEYDRALEWCQRALDGYEKTLGRDHPSILCTVYNMSIAFDRQGERDRALEWCQRALDGCEKRLGKAHPHTVYVRATWRNFARERTRSREFRQVQCRDYLTKLA